MNYQKTLFTILTSSIVTFGLGQNSNAQLLYTCYSNFIEGWEAELEQIHWNTDCQESISDFNSIIYVSDEQDLTKVYNLNLMAFDQLLHDLNSNDVNSLSKNVNNTVDQIIYVGKLESLSETDFGCQVYKEELEELYKLFLERAYIFLFHLNRNKVKYNIDF